jgi:very-short-patch-repair endonuclease
MGVEYEQEVQLGRWSVDFLADGWLAIEVDGTYWHTKDRRDMTPKYEAVRERGWTLLRLTVDGVTDETRIFVLREISRCLLGGRGLTASNTQPPTLSHATT